MASGGPLRSLKSCLFFFWWGRGPAPTLKYRGPRGRPLGPARPKALFSRAPGQPRRLWRPAAAGALFRARPLWLWPLSTPFSGRGPLRVLGSRLGSFQSAEPVLPSRRLFSEPARAFGPPPAALFRAWPSVRRPSPGGHVVGVGEVHHLHPAVSEVFRGQVGERPGLPVGRGYEL